MNSNASPPIYFVHNKKYFVVFGGYTGIGKLNDNPGKNGCRTWRFVVQEYDPLEVETMQCTILKRTPCVFLTLPHREDEPLKTLGALIICAKFIQSKSVYN